MAGREPGHVHFNEYQKLQLLHARTGVHRCHMRVLKIRCGTKLQTDLLTFQLAWRDFQWDTMGLAIPEPITQRELG